jgi:NADH dehydrogenase FAD-containing subunit
MLRRLSNSFFVRSGSVLRSSSRASSAVSAGSQTVIPSPDNQPNKPTVVVIGTGWAGAYFVRDLKCKELCNLVVLSQRNHMVFTPLLPQTCSGTLEFRSICEPIQRVQPDLATLPNVFYRTMVYDINFDTRTIQCVAVGVIGSNDAEIPVKSFDVNYDTLVLAHGARPNTFNIPGVEEHAFFLREISEARGIRRRLMQNLMTAALPTTDQEEVNRLLHIVVVGGGPTGVEFAADLADFLSEDIPKVDPRLLKFFRVTLLEAREVLGTFDLTLRNHGVGRLQRMGVKLKKATVAEVTPTSVTLSDGEVMMCGMVVWSTGVGPSSLTKEIKCDRTKQGRIAIDKHLRVLRDGKPLNNVYAMGDCAADVENPLPTLAAVASRQGRYLAKRLNHLHRHRTGEYATPFNYRSLGSMVSLGSHEALVELVQPKKFDFKGFRALLIYKSAYLSQLGSYRNKLYVIVNWFGSYIFGRDVTYFAELSEAKLWKSLAKEGASREQARRRVLVKASENKKGTLTAKSMHDASKSGTMELDQKVQSSPPNEAPPSSP